MPESRIRDLRKSRHEFENQASTVTSQDDAAMMIETIFDRRVQRSASKTVVRQRRISPVAPFKAGKLQSLTLPKKVDGDFTHEVTRPGTTDPLKGDIMRQSKSSSG